jgi:hypothetical protein
VHNFDAFQQNGGSYAAFSNIASQATSTTASATTGVTVDSSGVSGTDANYPPFIAVYMWKRTA